MRKSLLLVLALAACSSTKDASKTESELYDRVAYLRASYDTAYADYNTAAIDAIYQEMRRHANHKREVFVRDLRGAHSGRKKLAAFALAFGDKDKAAQEALIGVLGNEREDSGTVEIVLIALGMLRMEDTPLNLFTARFSHPSWQIRQAALYGFRFQLEAHLARPEAKLDEETFAAIVGRLSDTMMDVRNEAVICLRQVRTPAVIEPILQYVIRDPHPLVRQNCAITLAALGTGAQEAVGALIDLLKDPDTKVVEAAWTALTRITGKDFDRTHATWREWHDEEEKRMEYVCPDHPGVTESLPGRCPKCSKKLQRQARAEDYRCPLHPDVRLGKPGQCSTCRRTLEPRHPEYECPKHPGTRYPTMRQCPTCQTLCVPVRESFTCTEHPDVNAPFSGRCSRCERDLVRRVEYLCLTHPDVHGRRTDKCPKCGKPLSLFLPDYYCRDHPAVRTDRPGKCKTCQKDLVQVPDRFTCPKHPDADSPKPGKCSGCESDLVPKK